MYAKSLNYNIFMYAKKYSYDFHNLIAEGENIELKWLENDIIEGVEEHIAKNRISQLKNKKITSLIDYNRTFHLSMSFLDNDESDKIVSYISNIGHITFCEIRNNMVFQKIKISFHVTKHITAIEITNDLIKKIGYLYPDFTISF